MVLRAASISPAGRRKASAARMAFVFTTATFGWRERGRRACERRTNAGAGVVGHGDEVEDIGDQVARLYHGCARPSEQAGTHIRSVQVLSAIDRRRRTLVDDLDLVLKDIQRAAANGATNGSANRVATARHHILQHGTPQVSALLGRAVPSARKYARLPTRGAPAPGTAWQRLRRRTQAHAEVTEALASAFSRADLEPAW
jgi:hypothetical protein